MLVLKIAAGIILASVLLVGGCSALISSSGSPAPKYATADPVEDVTPTADPAAVEDSSSGNSTASDNASRSAAEYLSTAAFSRSGLIGQLKFEGYSTADATAAVDGANVDWNAQAAGTAKEYLDTMAFSRSGLIGQLEFDGYTASQAEYGVSQSGL